MSDGAKCDTCGRFFAWSEFVETIEEYLCEECASGISDDDDEYPDYDWSEDE